MSMKYTILFTVIGLLLCVLVVGCTSAPQNQPFEGRVVCTEPRPEVCTMDYNPACGDNGRTYSNACGACADAAVAYSDVGACAGDVTDGTRDAVY